MTLYRSSPFNRTPYARRKAVLTAMQRHDLPMTIIDVCARIQEDTGMVRGPQQGPIHYAMMELHAHGYIEQAGKSNDGVYNFPLYRLTAKGRKVTL